MTDLPRPRETGLVTRFNYAVQETSQKRHMSRWDSLIQQSITDVTRV
jgi:hypothetical protein